MAKSKPVVNQRNLACFVASFTRLTFNRRKPKDQWCQSLDAVAEKIVTFCARDLPFSLALDRVTGSKVQRTRLFRVELMDGNPQLDELTVLADTGWVCPGDYETLATGLEQVVLAAAHVGMSRRELEYRVVPRKEEETPS